MAICSMPCFSLLAIASLAKLLLVCATPDVIDRIDTHHHFIPPVYREYLEKEGLGPMSDMPLPEWSVEASLEMMDRSGIARAILSVSSPGTPYGGLKDVPKLVRQLNDYAAKEVVAKHPDRFGFFAFLPMPDLQASIEEARYALDVLKADGVVLLGNARGRYFAEQEFHPLLAELNRRGAVLYCHPNFLSGGVQPGMPPFVADFTLDTVRAAFLYVSTGAAEKYPHVRVLLSHAGGFMPFIASRMAMGITAVQKGLEGAAVSKADIALLQKFYVDTALSATPFAFPSILAFTTPARMTYGSDFPFAAQVQGYFDAELGKRFENDTASLAQISSGTAASLFPHLARQSRPAHDAAEL